jgi:D-tyrosyl-tRNA(Tyr) deacylase
VRLVLQRVSRAAVEIDGERVAAIGRGLLVLAGVAPGDDPRTAVAAAAKIARLRVFDDAEGTMNLDLAAAGGSVLLVSQFTLLADSGRGRRPSFAGAARPEQAEPLIARLAEELERLGVAVECGRFGAHMTVELVNDGPVTLVVDLGGDG